MKLGLLSDIHGNHFALEAVLDSAKKKGVDMLLVAGDLVGYYFWPKEVLQLLSGWDAFVVRGNHEEMLKKVLTDSSTLFHIEEKYGRGLRIALETLLPEQLDWLTNLPHPCEITIEGCRILLCHGSPWDIDRYIYPDMEAKDAERLLELNYDLIVLGHTHYPMVHKCGDSLVINPGSVGQPRNRKPGAYWAMLDTRTMVVNTFIEEYGIDGLIEQIKIKEPRYSYLWEVLTRT